ncbi:MAG: 50S ribosomal protein L11 methyltransferase [Porticoccaceae bacterium]
MSDSRQGWQQLSLMVPGAAAERHGDALLAAGALAVTLSDAGDNPVLEPPPGETPLWEQVCLTGLFAGDCDRAQAWLHLAAALLPEPVPAARWSELGERPWNDLWREHFKPRHCGGRLWICPSWCAPPEPAAINLRLDPGLAFGSGDHPTTALCLEWLAAAPPAGASTLDFGCGSGILAIAACLLGAARAVAVDIDPQALTATRANAQRNGIAPDQLETTAPGALAGHYTVVLANILANPLIELAPRIAALTAPGGRLCLSGILESQCAAVCDAYAPWFDFAPPTLRESWARLTGSKAR